MVYGAEIWTVKLAREKKLDVVEMSIYKMDRGVTKLEIITHEIIRGTTNVGAIFKKLQESRLKWYGHVLRRDEEYKYVDKTVMAMNVSEKRRSGRPMRRWLDNIRNDLSERELSGKKSKTGLNGGVS